MFRLTDEDVTIPLNANKVNINNDPATIKDIRNVLDNVTVSVRSEDTCIVSEIHKMIKTGGLYVDTQGLESTQFVLTPLSLVVTTAGGIATNGSVDIVDLKPKYQDNTTAAYMGDSDIITKLFDDINVTEEEQVRPSYFP